MIIHPLAKVFEQVSRNPSRNFQLPTLTVTPQTPHLLNHTCWCHLADKFKPYC